MNGLLLFLCICLSDCITVLSAYSSIQELYHLIHTECWSAWEHELFPRMCVYLPIIWCTSFRHPRQENTLTRSEKALYVWWLFCAIRDIIVSKLVFFNVDINENGKFECGDFKWKMLLVSEWFRHTRKKELRVLPMVVKSTPLRLVLRTLCHWALWHSW